MTDPILIFCLKLKEKLPAMPHQPFPGKLGTFIQANISQQAWNAWLVEQTKLINEYRLDPLSQKAQVFLEDEMSQYLNLTLSQIQTS